MLQMGLARKHLHILSYTLPLSKSFFVCVVDFDSSTHPQSLNERLHIVQKLYCDLLYVLVLSELITTANVACLLNSTLPLSVLGSLTRP